jgi:PDZ domain
MFEFTAKRQKIISSFFCLSLSLVLMVGCIAPVVTVSRLAMQVESVISLIDFTYKMSIVVSNLVDNSYQDLGDKIKTKDFSVDAIESMETKYSNLSTEHNKLDSSLSKTKGAANELFSMLQTNADENSTPELKRKMLTDISVNRKAFDQKIAVAENVSSQITASIKKYKDILGFLQNKTALKDVDGYIETIDKTIANAKLLDRDVQTALVEGRQIIKQYEQTSSPQPNEEVSTLPPSTITSPTPNATTTENPTTTQQVDRPFLGVEMYSLTPELRQKINENPKANIELDLDRGVLVARIIENSPAAAAGLQVGDVIVEIDGKAVTDFNEVTAEIGKSAVGTELTLQVRRNRQNRQVPVRLSAIPSTPNVTGNDNN